MTTYNIEQAPVYINEHSGGAFEPPRYILLLLLLYMYFTN